MPKTIVNNKGCAVVYYPLWIPLNESHKLLKTLMKTLPLEQQDVVIAGRRYKQPRLTSWHSDANEAYIYSGVERPPCEWTPELEDIKQRLHKTTGYSFNSALCNLYRDGKDSIGVHSDDESSLGPTPNNVVIASVSLGSPRTFILKEKKGEEEHKLGLGCGDLLVMAGKTQKHWQHEIPKTKDKVGPRLNLTFRILL